MLEGGGSDFLTKRSLNDQGAICLALLERATVGQAKPRNDLFVIELTIQNIDIARILVDTGSSADIIFKTTLEKMGTSLSEIAENPSPLV